MEHFVLNTLKKIAGQPWSSFTKQFGSTTPPDLSDPGNEIGLEIDSHSMKLKKEDLAIFGCCPTNEIFELAVCNYCGDKFKMPALSEHIKLRHKDGKYSNAKSDESIDKSNLSPSKKNRGRHKKANCKIVKQNSPVDTSNGKDSASRKPTEQPIDVKLVLREAIVSNSDISAGGQTNSSTSQSSPSSYTSAQNPTPVSSPLTPLSSATTPTVTPNSTPIKGSPDLTKVNGPHPNVINDKLKSVKHKIKKAKNNSIDKGLKNIVTSTSSFKIKEKSKDIKRNTSKSDCISSPTVSSSSKDTEQELNMQPVVQLSPLGNTPKSNSVLDTKKKAKPDKKVPSMRDRTYNPDKHCGVVTGKENSKPCTRSLTCKTHSMILRRAVEGRSKAFDLLLADHRAEKEIVRKRHFTIQIVNDSDKSNDSSITLISEKPAVSSSSSLKDYTKLSLPVSIKNPSLLKQLQTPIIEVVEEQPSTSQLPDEKEAEQLVNQLMQDIAEVKAVNQPVKTPQPQIQKTPQPQIQKSPQSQIQKSPQPQIQKSPQPQIQKAPQPQIQKAPQPQIQKVPQPQIQKAPQPQIQKAPQPQIQKAPQPQTQKASQPQTQKTSQPQTQKASQPQNQKSPQPQNQKAPQPQIQKAAQPQIQIIQEKVIEQKTLAQPQVLNKVIQQVQQIVKQNPQQVITLKAALQQSSPQIAPPQVTQPQQVPIPQSQPSLPKQPNAEITQQTIIVNSSKLQQISQIANHSILKNNVDFKKQVRNVILFRNCKENGWEIGVVNKPPFMTTPNHAKVVNEIPRTVPIASSHQVLCKRKIHPTNELLRDVQCDDEFDDYMSTNKWWQPRYKRCRGLLVSKPMVPFKKARCEPINGDDVTKSYAVDENITNKNLLMPLPHESNILKQPDRNIIVQLPPAEIEQQPKPPPNFYICNAPHKAKKGVIPTNFIGQVANSNFAAVWHMSVPFPNSPSVTQSDGFCEGNNVAKPILPNHELTIGYPGQHFITASGPFQLDGLQKAILEQQIVINPNKIWDGVEPKIPNSEIIYLRRTPRPNPPPPQPEPQPQAEPQAQSEPQPQGLPPPIPNK